MQTDAVIYSCNPYYYFRTFEKNYVACEPEPKSRNSDNGYENGMSGEPDTEYCCGRQMPKPSPTADNQATLLEASYH